MSNQSYNCGNDHTYKDTSRHFFDNRKIVIKIPKVASKTVGVENLPKATNVELLATIIPAFFKPTKAIKKPIPAPIASFNCTGIALIIILRIPVTEIIKRQYRIQVPQLMQPARNTPSLIQLYKQIMHLLPYRS